MIHQVKGNLLDAKGIILHGCNAQGVMGSGVANAIRAKWPRVYEEYVDFIQNSGGCALADEYMGEVFWVELGDVWVGNCITQEFYGRDGLKYLSYDAIDRCMQEVARVAPQFPGADINFPLIGCGLAGGYWPVVEAIIEHRIPDTFKKVLWTL